MLVDVIAFPSRASRCFIGERNAQGGPCGALANGWKLGPTSLRIIGSIGLRIIGYRPISAAVWAGCTIGRGWHLNADGSFA